MSLSEDNERLELASATELPSPKEKKGLWKKLKRGLFMTHTEILDRTNAALKGRVVLDDATLEYLEESLIAADLGVETSLELVERLKEQSRTTDIRDPSELRRILAEEVSNLLVEIPPPDDLVTGPMITLIVGVNGVGKTTTIAKLGRWLLDRDQKVLFAAGDTFRAAAIEQIVLWGERLGVGVIRQRAGGDPAAVVYDAVHAALARKTDHLIVDTAGRLHTKSHLMEELGKISRVIDREAKDWRCRTLLVLDATTGQNALAQAKQFAKKVSLDGVVLTKLDGTAKGGMAISVARELGVPVLFLGVGEAPEDLIAFEARDFATALFD